MKILIKALTVSAAFIFTLVLLLPTRSEGIKLGTVKKVDIRSGEIIVGSSTAARDIRMGDLMYVLVEGKTLIFKATFPMQTIARCRFEGKNRALIAKVRKGMPVYRYRGENRIGQHGPGGGWIFYDKGAYSDGWRYLEGAPVDQVIQLEWGCSKKSIKGAAGQALGTGRKNTAAILKGCDQPEIAARRAAGYRGGGKEDWFLPSRDELEKMSEFFIKSGVGNISPDHYWSSTEVDGNTAWFNHFVYGITNFDVKESKKRVRAVRAY
mgnify:CR=1 FL=1